MGKYSQYDCSGYSEFCKCVGENCKECGRKKGQKESIGWLGLEKMY